MAHQIMENDEMMYFGETPWHKLGIESDHPLTIQEVYEICFNWDIVKEKLFTSDGLVIPDKYAVVRVNRDGHRIPLGAVGGVYSVNQNKKWADTLEGIVGTDLACIETAGTLKNGRLCWVAFKVNAEPVSNGKDPIEPYLSFMTSHDGTMRNIFTAGATRIVCANTLFMALQGATNIFAVKHTESQTEKMKQAEHIFSGAFKYFRQLGESLEVLKKIKLNVEQQKTIVKELVSPKKQEQSLVSLPEGAVSWAEVESKFKTPDLEMAKLSTRTENTINKIMELTETGKGVDLPDVKGTAYGLYNAVGEYVDHYQSTRARGKDGSVEKEQGLLENRFLSVMTGSGADLKQKTFDRLISLA